MKRDGVIKVLVIALIFIGGVLMFTSWEWRARLFSYVPIALFLGHVGLFALASFRERYWRLFKLYFLVPVIVYITFFSQYLKTYNSSDWGNPLGFLGLPFAPFVLPVQAERKIAYKKADMRRREVVNGDISLDELIRAPQQLFESEKKGIIYRLKEGDEISPFLLDMLILAQTWGGSYEDKYAIDFLLNYPKTSSTTIRQFYAKDIYGHFESIITNPNTPLELIEEMARSENYFKKIAALKSSRLDDSLEKETMWFIVHSENNGFSLRAKSYVAGLEKTSVEMLEAMIGVDDSLDYDVAKNINVTPEILSRFASHSSNHVRAAVANNPQTPREAYYRLIQNKDGSAIEWWRLRKFAGLIERNPNAPKEVRLKVQAIKKEGNAKGQ